MNVTINGEASTIDAMSLTELCATFQDDPLTIATAVNGSFVAVNERAALQLQDGDKIEILSPRQGG